MKSDRSTHHQFSIRRGTVSDTVRICSLFEREYGDSSHPCLDEHYVWSAVSNKSELWFVAEEATGDAIGCMSVSYNAQNRSWEFGRAMTSQRHRKMGIVSSLLRSIIDAMPVAENDLAFAIARNDIALRAMQGHVDAVVVGHDGSPNMVHGVHEHHVVAIEKFRSPRFKHWLPISSVFRDSGFLRSEILEPLGLAGTPEKYPDTCLWGHGDEFSDGFTFRLDARVDAIYLCQHIGGPFMTERDITADLLRFLKRRSTTPYIGAIVLADKLMLITAMLETGFCITAYLPAWHWNRGARYDCVLLARRSHNFANKNGLDAHVDTFDAAYRDIGQRILTI
ncbi:GNAT family N-acetyltransferase [Burkholderia pyrrocinia]